MVRKVVSLYEDTKETFLSDGIEIGEEKGIEIGEKRGIEIGERRGIEIGKREAYDVPIEHLLDLAIVKSKERGISLEQYLETSDYDEPLREEILSHARRRSER